LAPVEEQALSRQIGEGRFTNLFPEAVQYMPLRAAKWLADCMKVLDMQVDEARERVFAADTLGRRVDFLVDGMLGLAGPFVRVHFAVEGFGQRMAISADLNPPLAPALLDRCHGMPLQTDRFRTHLARAQSGHKEPKNVRQHAESLANKWAQTALRRVCPTA